MTKPTDDGGVVQRTYGDLEHISEQNMNRLLTVILDLRNGANDTEAAFSILLEMYKDEAQRLRVMTYLRMKHINDAGALAEKLAATNNILFLKQK